ncbi:hypothetical protein D9758_013141 [Tetrapyrgos nigripes]|uniref:Major facilitator superfamily (MFS) profile domain-containing protein n=1 Tax=Tetrapyrgos nigripes TaxID=182062 RepID=A0A8H5CFE2_9AGAR|nr:hypothetical protein D9758_013141 [Tetrapyrgos nigripes]
MASVTPRASVFWSDPDMSFNDFDDDDVEEQLLNDGRTPLDRTIDRIGMGSYQWTLLSLCGFGWMADNMWIEAVAIILPRVQQHYSVSDAYIGTLSSSMFAGMMFGAVGWGTCSDLMGRSAAFNLTLFFTSSFGLLASLANSFTTICVILFFLGSAVGGSMPTDGTLLLEHMPNGKQYLVTALSVFFSFGAVLSAVVALLVVPQNSCPLNPEPGVICDVETQNKGWKYLLGALGLTTLSMFLARIVFFRLHESPRYLVHAGRHQEALESLQMISKFNGSDLELDLGDVNDERPSQGAAGPGTGIVTSPQQSTSVENQGDGENQPFLARKSTEDLEAEERRDPIQESQSQSESLGGPDLRTSTLSSADLLNRAGTDTVVNYASITTSPPKVEANLPGTDAEGTGVRQDGHRQEEESYTRTPRPIRPGRRSRITSRASMLSRRRSSVYERRLCTALPRWIRKPLWAWWDRVMMVLTPEWLSTTLLVWGAWFGMSLAYTMFNVFLPKLLESGSRSSVTEPQEKSLEASLWDVVIFTIGGCPGAILGAYMVNSSLGRRWSLASSTFVTAFFCVVFVWVESTWAVRITTVGISLSATAMWAVLYGWTPEIFGTEVRGTACGIASALSRVGGMIAPLLGGVLLSIDRAVPVYTSVVVFCLAGTCVLFLKEDAGDAGKANGGQRVIVH